MKYYSFDDIRDDEEERYLLIRTRFYDLRNREVEIAGVYNKYSTACSEMNKMAKNEAPPPFNEIEYTEIEFDEEGFYNIDAYNYVTEDTIGSDDGPMLFVVKNDVNELKEVLSNFGVTLEF